MIERLNPSDPKYEEYNRLQTMLCQALNPHMLVGFEADLGKVEMKCVVVGILGAMEKFFDKPEVNLDEIDWDKEVEA